MSRAGVLGAVAVMALMGGGASRAVADELLDDGTRCLDLADLDYDRCYAREKSFWLRALCEIEYWDDVRKCKEAVKG